jgi:hypothetical protein
MSTAIASGRAGPAIAGALLHAWETLRQAAPIERAIGLLDAVWPEHGRDRWRALSIGDRDACLFLLQASLFGEELKTVATCPACGERLESSFATAAACPPPTHWPQPREPLQLDHGRWRIRYRLPSSDDLMSSSDEDGDDPVASLLRRCVLAAERDGRQHDAAQLPDEVRRRIGDAMSEHDPVADLRVGVICPACGHAWSATLDIVAYLWDELDDWAQDLLAEVHVLARHYAWSERDILALSPVRRRFYLDLLQA